MTAGDLVEVIQADREAAFELVEALFASWGHPPTLREKSAYLLGEHDQSGVVQAFARHRQAADYRPAQAAGGEVVAWMYCHPTLATPIFEIERVELCGKSNWTETPLYSAPPCPQM